MPLSIPSACLERVLPLLNQGMGAPNQYDIRINLRRIEPFGNVRDAAPALTVSRVGSTAMSLQGGAEAFDEGGCGEWLGQEANCSGLQRSGADAVIRKGRDENERHTITLGAHRR